MLLPRIAYRSRGLDDQGIIHPRFQIRLRLSRAVKYCSLARVANSINGALFAYVILKHAATLERFEMMALSGAVFCVIAAGVP